MSDVSFADLGLAEPLLRALDAAKYTVPTPIQARTIPLLLQGRDMLGIAQTGTGKTAAFALPILQRLAAAKDRAQPKSAARADPRADPRAGRADRPQLRNLRRDLGLRLAHHLRRRRHGRQVDTLQRGVDILVATPGRLLDLIERRAMSSSARSRSSCSTRPTACSTWASSATSAASSPRCASERQTLLFSATMPPEIAKLADRSCTNPARVEIAPAAPHRRADRPARALRRTPRRKRALLSHLLADAAIERVIVFTRTKHGANRVAEALEQAGVSCRGDPRQQVPERAPAGARRLHAAARPACWSRPTSPRAASTSTASRHVVNYDLPDDAESYVHRIGRTARAGASGIAMSFCDGSERGQLKSIERLTNQRLAVLPTPAPWRLSPPAPPARAQSGTDRSRTRAMSAGPPKSRPSWRPAAPSLGDRSLAIVEHRPYRGWRSSAHAC